MADSKSSQNQSKVTAERMFNFVKAIVDAGLEKEFLDLCGQEKFYLSGRARSMKIAADFLRSADARIAERSGNTLATASSAEPSLMQRVCRDATCDF